MRGITARDALGELWTETRHNGSVVMRRLALPPEVAQELERTVTAAARVTHPVLLRPLEVGERKGVVQVVHEAVRGKTLREVLAALASRGSRMQLSQATWIVLELLRGLQLAHQAFDRAQNSRGVFHGRISPEHVVISQEGQVRLAGLGLDPAARHLLGRASQADPAFCYVAPEQCDGTGPTGMSDVFSCAAVLMEALLGRPLFLQGTVAQTFEAIQSAPLPDLRSARPEVPKALDELIGWCLVRDVNKRCARAETVVNRLTAFQGMLEAGDKLKAVDQKRRLADLVALATPAASPRPAQIAVAPLETTLPGGFDDDPQPIVTKVVASPRRPPLRRRAAAAATVALALVVGALGTWVMRDRLATVASRVDPLGKARAVRALVADAVLSPAPVGGLPGAPLRELGPGPVAGPVERVAAGGLEEPPPPPGFKKIEQAVLSIRTVPSVVVKLGDSELGRTPLRNVRLPPGAHTLKFWVPGKPPLSRRISVAEGEQKNVSYRLKFR